MGTTVEELKRTAKAAQDALWRIERDERLATSKGLVGKAFKYRNSYSCPEKPSDYFWLYLKIVSVDKSDGRPIAMEFQTDKYGDLSMRFRRHMFAHMSGYQEIPLKEFNVALTKFKKVVADA